MNKELKDKLERIGKEKSDILAHIQETIQKEYSLKKKELEIEYTLKRNRLMLNICCDELNIPYMDDQTLKDYTMCVENGYSTKTEEIFESFYNAQRRQQKLMGVIKDDQ